MNNYIIPFYVYVITFPYFINNPDLANQILASEGDIIHGGYVQMFLMDVFVVA